MTDGLTILSILKWFLVIVFLSCLGYAFLIEPNYLSITENRFDIGAPEQLKIVFASDFHAGQQAPGYLESLVLRINAQNPDLVLLGGDFIEEHSNEIEKLEPLRKLKSKYGAYAVLGNHDYGQWGCGANPETGNAVAEKLNQMGITVLRNENRKIRGTALIGLDDAWMCLNNYEKASAGTSGLPRIVLSHNYLAVPVMENNTLVLSGHSHCGQIRIPFLSDFLLAPIFGLLGNRYKIGNGEMYITCGVAAGPARFLAPPEISVVFLESKEKQPPQNSQTTKTQTPSNIAPKSIQNNATPSPTQIPTALPTEQPAAPTVENYAPPVMITPYVNEADISSINEAYSYDANNPYWGFWHPGVDFMIEKDLVEFRAVAEGTIVNLNTSKETEKQGWHTGLCIDRQPYTICYNFEAFSPDDAIGVKQAANILVKNGEFVKQGQLLGSLVYGGSGAHVDFGLIAPNHGRICPELYFTEEARQSVLRLIHKKQPSWPMCYP